ncbi:MAG: allophanate hydrolase [Endomicrobiaceae bacterium]
MLPNKISISWLRKQYLSGSLTPHEVIEEIFKRIERDNDMNIWISKPDISLIERHITKLETFDILQYPLWAVPFAIKDNIDMEGIPTTAGCPEFSYMPQKSAEVVQSLINAGAIPLGKTNLDQFATGLVGTRSPYGQTHNALNPELISGGSSSGSAVCVARGQAAFALGTDTAGSGRIPAALNDIYGFKPSKGAWPTSGVVPACESLDCVSVFANSTEDCLTVDKIVRKYEPDDKWSREIPVPESKTPKFICLPESGLEFFGNFAKSYHNQWNTFLEKIPELNIPIKFINPKVFFKAAEILYEGAYVSERWTALGSFVEKNGKYLFPVTKQILESGKKPGLTAAKLFEDLHKLKEYKRKVSILLKDAVLIMPTSGGTWTRKEVDEKQIETNSKMGIYTNHCNLLDLAALAVPYDKTHDNMPFGITLFSLFKDEGLLFKTAEEIKSITKKSLIIAVHGLHMRTMPLNMELLDLDAKFLRTAITAAEYKLYALKTVPEKPGLVYKGKEGYSIETELWEIPIENFAKLINSVKMPMTFGKIKLEDNTEVTGFLCEPYALNGTKDISSYHGWKKYFEIEQKTEG